MISLQHQKKKFNYMLICIFHFIISISVSQLTHFPVHSYPAPGDVRPSTFFNSINTLYYVMHKLAKEMQCKATSRK